MARTWREVREQTSGLLDEQRVTNATKLLHEAVRAYRLSEVRKQQAITQTELAATMKVTQARVSKIERGDLSRTEMGTLESYVEALGGHLRVVADFGDHSVIVR